MRKLSVLAALVLSIGTMLAISAPAPAQNNSNQVGLVNVSVGDVNVLNDANIAVAAELAATICDVNVPIAILAEQLLADGSSTVCETVAGPVVIEQTQAGGAPGGGGGGGNNSQQAGLVNVSLGDVNILNNANLAVAAAIAATICDVNVPVAVLAQQVLVDGEETVCTTDAGDVTVEQSQGPDGPGGDQGGGNFAEQVGLVNVALGDVNILNDANVAVAAAIAATICDVNVPVAVLAQQVLADGGETVCTTDAGDVTVTQAA